MTALQKTQKVSMGTFLSTPSVKNFVNEQLGEKSGEFVSNILALVNNDENLKACDPNELMMCAINATALNLPLNKNLGYAYVIPYNKNVQISGQWVKKQVPQFQIGYKGFIQLAIRTGMYKTINAVEVREGEIKRNKFTGEITFFDENEEGEIIGYLSYIKMHNGFEQSFFMTKDQALKHAIKYSKSFAKYKTGIWADDFDAMAIKTVLKLLLGKYGTLSTEIQKAIIEDQKVGDDYGDNPNNTGSRKVEDAEVIEQPEPKETSVPKSGNSVNLEDL